MQVQEDDARGDFLVHVRVRIPMRDVERASSVYGVDVGNCIYDAIYTALQGAGITPEPIEKPVARLGNPNALVQKVTRKIELDD